MSLGQQLRALNTAAASFRQDLFGTTAAGSPVQIDYNRGQHTFTGYYSPLKEQQRTEEAGAWVIYDTVVRFARTVPFTPALNQQLLVRESSGTETKEVRLVIIALGGTHPASSEWVLGCKALNV